MNGDNGFKPDVESILARLKEEDRPMRRKKTAEKKTQTLSTAFSLVVIFTVTGLVSFDIYRQEWAGTQVENVASVIPDNDTSYLILSDGSTVLLEETTVPVELYEKGEGKDKTKLSTAEPESVRYNELFVARKNYRILTLPDGTKVTVNSASSLVFPDRFQEGERRVRLTGEAYFDVVSDQTRPFIVETGHCHTVVLGTVLNVSAYENEEESEVTLVRGSVKVVSTDGARSVTLSPGQQAVVSDGKIATRNVDTNLYTSWIDGVFRFEDSSLGEIMKQISRWYDVDFAFASQEAGRIRFTGIMERNNTLEEILRRIEKSGNVKFEKNHYGYEVR